MLPGFLHFDCRNGLRAELLNGALFELLCDQKCIFDALTSLGFSGISIEVKKGSQGSLIEIDALPPEIGPSLLEIKALFAGKKVDVAIASLALAILDQVPENLSFDKKWLVEELAILCAQVAKLDPKFISASKLRLGNIETGLSQILLDLPIIEVETEQKLDILAIAFLKTLVGHWGARGEHTLLKAGIGRDQSESIEALWCEASLPESMNEVGPSNKARLRSLYEISGLSPCNLDMALLGTSLSLHGAKDFSWHLAHGDHHINFYQVKFFCNNEDKRDAIEAFLIKGEANRVSVSLVEMHEINRRQVAIPLGTGNKTSSMRFWEYTYYDKIVRVEPLREDLDHYIIKTDYSADVARSDALLAWKKWRGRTAEDK